MRAGLARLVVGAVCVLGMVGCSGGAFSTANETAASVAGVEFGGVVHGGQQPIAGAHVYLFAAGTSGYGGVGIAASTSNASSSLLTAGIGTALDSSGGATNGDYYVTTGLDGSFSLTGDYSCTTGQQVYLYALGGNAGAGTNAAAGLMAVLGNCPGGTSAFASGTPYVVINEVSTVAAAYAMAGFATDAVHVGSSGTPLALVGIKNAFANAANLETLSTGVALATTPAGNGTVPQAEINTLADILASCVNSNGAVTGGTSATNCYTLFTSALAGGGVGTQPTDTATAAINVAQNPGVNVSALYGLAAGTPPFSPGLTSAPPNSWALALTFSGGGLPQANDQVRDSVLTSETITLAPGIAVDGAGNVWMTSPSNNGLVELSSSGAFLSGPSGYWGGGLNGPTSIAIDPGGNAWVANYTGSSLSAFSSSGMAESSPIGYKAGGISSPVSIAVDGAGNVWVENETQTITKLSGSGTSAFSVPFNPAFITGNNILVPQMLAIDGMGDVWITSGTSNAVFEISGSGAPLSGSYGFQGGGGYNPANAVGVAMDTSGDAWIAEFEPFSPSELNSSGAMVQDVLTGAENSATVAIDGAGTPWFAGTCVEHLPASGRVRQMAYCPTNSMSGAQIAIDGAGDVWLANGFLQSGSPLNLVELVGAATPVVTPLSVGVKNNMLGTRP